MKECAAEGRSVPECHVLREKNHSAVDIWRQSPVSGDRVQFTEDGGMRRFQPSFFVPRKNFAPMEYFVSVRQKLSFPVKTEPAADQERGNEICL